MLCAGAVLSHHILLCTSELNSTKMSTWRAHLTFLHLFLLFAITVKGAPCNGATKSVTVNADGGVLYSSDYPENYYNSETCQWLLTAATNSKVIQLETLDIELEQENDACVDYLAAYDGTSDQAPLLKKWCGTDKAFVHSTGQNLFLKFVSNTRVTRKGFAIAYHEITSHDVTCKDGQAVSVPVGSTPVLYNFQHPNRNVRKCLWRFEPEGSGQRLALTVMSSSGNFIQCTTGYFALHDGADTSDAEILHWCDIPNAPMAAFYPSGSALMVMDRSSVGKQFSFQLSLKVQTRSAQGTCTGNDVPVIQVHKYAAPIFVALPYITTTGGASCPVLFREIEDGSSFRVDVLAVDNKAASCSSSAVSVYRGQAVNPAKSVQSECWNDSRPFFMDLLNAAATVAPTVGKTSVIQVLATDFYCTGFTQSILAFRSTSKEERAPQVMSDYLGYKSYCVMRFVLKGDREGDHPLVQLGASLDLSVATVKVYDGQSTNDRVLYTVNKTIPVFSNRAIGSGHYLMVELSTPGLGHLNFLTMKYSAVPVTVLCNNSIDEHFQATSTPKNLSSAGYRDYYPVDFLCRYTISTEKEGEVVHLKVLDADFSNSCENNLRIFNGNNVFSKDYQLGLVCGGNPNNPTKLESRGSVMKLVFHSAKDGSTTGGWKVQYYSAPPTPPEDTDEDDDNTASIVGGVLGAIIVVLLLLIIYLVVKRHRGAKASF